ncbi:MAG: HEPN domain-containing protein [Bacteroidales bacterium]|nr:HEPN domain-containing protein [Bacteroidales bacterium]MCF8387961.1 HEPN domain-containing protein [Bacteroidales bacterium]
MHQPAKRLKKKIKKYVNPSVPVNLIYHGIEYLNQEIEDGNYFFTDILKEGIRLHHSKRYTLSKPRNLTDEDRQRQARDYYEKWFKSAHIFFLDYQENFKRGEKDSDFYSKAAFELHQATERYYLTTLLVFTGYKPKTHDLEELDFRAGRLDARFKQVFPNKTEEEERLFGLLKKAYIDASYKMDYVIEQEELEYLAGRVELLREITEEVCRKRLRRAD